MAIERGRFAQFKNDPQGLSFHFPARWSYSTITSNDENWSQVSDGPLANLKVTLFAIENFASKWGIDPRDPVKALNPYLVYRNSRNANIQEQLDGSAINGQKAFSSTYYYEDDESEAGKRKAAIIHENQVAIIESEWQTKQHQTWVDKIISSLKMSTPLLDSQSCTVIMCHSVAGNGRLDRRELSMPYCPAWSLEYRPVSFQSISRFKMNSGRFSCHYFLNTLPGSQNSAILLDDHIQFERQEIGLPEKPEWELLQAREKITAIHTFGGGSEAVVGAGGQTLYLLADIDHAGFIRDLVSDINLNTKTPSNDWDISTTSLDSIFIQPVAIGPDQANGRWNRQYYSLTVDKQESLADSMDSVTAVFRVRNARWGPVANQEIMIATEPEVSIKQNRRRTGNDGQITAVLKSDHVTDVTICAFDATRQPLTTAKTVHFKPPPNVFKLIADKAEVWADGEEQVQVLVTAQDAQGRPLPGVFVRIQTSPEISITQTDLLTNQEGEVRGSFVCSEILDINLFAVDGSGKRLPSQQAISAVQPIDLQNSEMIFEEEVGQTLSEDVVNVRVIVRDALARPLPHRAIIIETDPEIVTYQPTAVTDMDGCLRATLRSDRPLTVKVSAIEKNRQFLIKTTYLRFVPPVKQPNQNNGRGRSAILVPREIQVAASPQAGQSRISRKIPTAQSHTKKPASVRKHQRQRWLIPAGLIIFGLVLFGLIECGLNGDGCGACQFWKPCWQQPITAIKGSQDPIISMTIGGSIELSDNGRYMIVPMRAVSPLFEKANRNRSGSGPKAVSDLISLETTPGEGKNPILILPESLEISSSANVLTFDLLIPTERLGEELLPTFVTKGYWVQKPFMLQSIPLAQIYQPQSLSDINFKPDGQIIEIQVDGRMVPVGTAAHWIISLWDPTSGELLGGEQFCHELKGVCLIAYDFSHACVTLDVKLIGQLESGNIQATEQFTACP